jgi:hypothetical protein
MSVHVTHHAIERYQQRVAPVEPAEAYAAIVAAERGIEAAAAFGGHIVKLANGARLIVRGRNRVHVVSVNAPGAIVGGPYAGSEQPACCGQCGLRCEDPVASACIRPDCPLGHHRRTANDGTRR